VIVTKLGILVTVCYGLGVLLMHQKLLMTVHNELSPPQIETTIIATKRQLLYQLESCRAHTKRPPETKWTKTARNVETELNNKEL